MAINKNAFVRYQILDKCFRNTSKRYSSKELLLAINEVLLDVDPDSNGIQKRQLYKDIEFMQSSEGFCIELDDNFKVGKFRYFRYLDPNFSISNSPINTQEAEQMKSALMVLSRFKGLPQFEWVQELIPKLETSFGFKSSNQEIIAFEQNQYLKGIEYLSILFDAIHSKTALKITYKSFKAEVSEEYIVHPYYLKQYNLRWFLFGMNAKYNTISNLALDRIEGIETTTQVSFIETEINFTEYFEDIIGVTKPVDGELVEVRLFFDEILAPYILTKPIHESMKVKERLENGIVISIQVIPNFELEKMILSHGETCKVLAPESLVLKLKNRVEAMGSNYRAGI